MAKYRPIFIEIWNDEDEFLKYTDSEKTLFFYLTTNKDCTESGIYKISPRTICFILNWDIETFNKSIKAISRNVCYDEEKKIIFVKNFYRYNGMRYGAPKNIEKSIINDCINFKTHLWHLFISTYPKFVQSLRFFIQTFSYTNTNTDNNTNTSLDEKGRTLASEFKEKLKTVARLE